MTRVIAVAVCGEYIDVSDRVLGAAGAANAVTLRMSFDSVWHGAAKRVYFVDAIGKHPVSILLTTDRLCAQETELYLVQVPAEALSSPGEVTVTVEGVVDADGNGEAEMVAVSASARFTVLESEIPGYTVNPAVPAADEMLQLQGEIDAIKADIVKAAQAAGAVESAAAAVELALAASEAAEDAAVRAAADAARASSIVDTTPIVVGDTRPSGRSLWFDTSREDMTSAMMLRLSEDMDGALVFMRFEDEDEDELFALENASLAAEDGSSVRIGR